MKLSQRIAIACVRTKIKLLSALSKKKAARYAFQLFCTPPRRHYPPLPSYFEQAETLSVTVNNLVARGWRWNHPSKKKLLVIHGFESSAVNFERYIKIFVEKGYEVMAFDAPAHGRSDGKRITAPLYAATIEAINREFGPIDSWIAHSFGGLALSLALENIRHDDEQRVVLIAPATESTTAIDSFFTFLRLPRSLSHDFNTCIIEAGGKPASWFSITRAVKNIQAQILWIHDEDDNTTPLADLETVRSGNYEHINFMITRGLGHRRIYRDPKVISEVTEFINGMVIAPSAK